MDNLKLTQKLAEKLKPAVNLSSLFNNFLAFVSNFIMSSQDIIGLDVGSSYIKIVQLQRKRKRYHIRKCITRALPQTARDNAGEKRKLVQEFVKEFIAETNTKSGLGRMAIYGKGVFIFSITVPNLNKKDMRGAVQIELKKRLPFQMDINSVNFDYFVTGQAQDERGVSLQASCIAADRLTIDDHIKLLKDMNLRPIAINTIPDCLGNLVSFCLDVPPKKTALILDIGATTSLLNFYKGRSLVFSREIPVGGDHLTHAMAKTVTLSTGTVTISADEAEKLKRNCGVPLQDEAKTEYLTDFGPFRGEQISAMLRPTLERLVMEINRTFSYYTKTFKSDLSDELYLTGGASRLKNLDKFLLFNLEGVQKVEILNYLKKIKGWADTGVLKQELMMEQAMPHMAVAFAICLGTGGRVNVLPVKERVEQKALLLSLALKIGMPLLLLLTLGFYGLNWGNAVKYKMLVRSMDNEILRLAPQTQLIRDYLAMKSALDERERTLERAKGKQPYWWGLFKEFSNVIPPQVTIQKISFVSSKEPKEIRLTGKIFAKYSIVDLELSQFQLALEESPYFSRVELLPPEKDMYSAIPAANFEIICQLNY